MASVKQVDFIAAPSRWLPARIDTPELLDMGAGSDEDVQANFADMWRINRYLGGVQAITQHLYPRLLAQTGTTTLVDIGTGAGDIGSVISGWAGRRDLDLKVWGLDLSARNLRLTRSPSSGVFDTRLQADGLHLPFKAGSVDYYISSLFLHHLSPDKLKKLLATTF